VVEKRQATRKSSNNSNRFAEAGSPVNNPRICCSRLYRSEFIARYRVRALADRGEGQARGTASGLAASRGYAHCPPLYVRLNMLTTRKSNDRWQKKRGWRAVGCPPSCSSWWLFPFQVFSRRQKPTEARPQLCEPQELLMMDRSHTSQTTTYPQGSIPLVSSSHVSPGEGAVCTEPLEGTIGPGTIGGGSDGNVYSV